MARKQGLGREGEDLVTPIRLPKGASWIRFVDDFSTHLLYQGVLWGFVFKTLPEHKTPNKWYSESIHGSIYWSKSEAAAKRLLVRTLRKELRRVKHLIATRGK